MVSWLARQLRYLFGFLWTNDSPRQIALGAALGIVLGLTPKGNLLAICLASVLLAVRVNTQAGMLAALLASFAAPWCDPLADKIGSTLLTAPSLRGAWTLLYNIPLAPWTGFNNTLVLGNFTLGWLLFYPAYRATLPAAERWQAHRRQKQQQATAAKAASTAAARDAVAEGSAAKRPRDSAVEAERMTIRLADATHPTGPRATLRQRRFREFVAEVESLSQRRGAA